MKSIFVSIFILLISLPMFAQQVDNDYNNPKDYEIGGIVISGIQHLDENIVSASSGLYVGKKITIPGNDISNAIKKLWKQNLFADVSIDVTKVVGKLIFLQINLTEKPRLSSYVFKGIKKKEGDDLKEKLGLIKGRVITEDIKVDAVNKIKQFYTKKGYPNAQISVTQKADTIISNGDILSFNIKPGKRVKINQITFNGNENIKSGKLKRAMKKTKTNPFYSVFTVSKFNEDLYEKDKDNIITKYNSLGFRDAEITRDTVYPAKNGNLNINISINEGKKYYLRDIVWKGNTKFTEKELSTVFGLKKGDVYNQELIDRKLNADPNGYDVTTLYMDKGYLFFRLTPSELRVDGDSIDLELKIYEGPQATVKNVTVKGNTRTHEHVIRREIRTLPGDKFSRTDLIRSQRDLMNLGFFNPEGLGVNPKPNPQDGTVDIEYTVEEKPSDKLELTLSYGGSSANGGAGIIGTVGVQFTNFSLRNLFKKGGWGKYLPQGDGQQLGLRLQATGKEYQSGNLSFTEPWLGGKKPNSFSFDVYHTRYTPSTAYVNSEGNTIYQKYITSSVGVSLGQRLQWPDDYFNLITSMRYQNYYLENYQQFAFINNGYLNNFSISEMLIRSSIDNPIFPKSGSNLSLTLSLTPPYSLFSKKNYSELSANEKYKWLEYHKWRYKAEFYKSLSKNIVLKAETKGAFLGYYNKTLGLAPLERFQIGGDGLANNIDLGNELISLRGYKNDINEFPANQNGAPIFVKHTLELRYLISPSPSSTAWAHVFAQGGNTFTSFRNFNPFDVKRSVGVGFRILLPIFGILGVDYGIGIDQNLGSGRRWHEFGNFNIVLGFEPE